MGREVPWKTTHPWVKKGGTLKRQGIPSNVLKNKKKEGLSLRKILVSVKFVSAILGPEMAVPILWTPGKMRSFCRKTHVHKIPRFRGGFFGGGECRFYFYGRADFSDSHQQGKEDQGNSASITPWPRTNTLIFRQNCFPVFRARHNPKPRSEVWWWNLRWSFGGKCFWQFSQQKKLEKLLPNFAGSSPPISPKTSPTSLWKSLVLMYSLGCEYSHDMYSRLGWYAENDSSKLSSCIRASANTGPACILKTRLGSWKPVLGFVCSGCPQLGDWKKHVNFLNINFLAPHPKHPHFGPPEKSSCASFPGKRTQKGTHINFFFGGDFGVKRGGPKRATFGQKKFSLLFFSCPYQLVEEAKPGCFQTGVFPTFFRKGPDCVADPFGTVPRRRC